MKAAYCVNWTEHEKGWGSRPDGHTLHASLKIAQDYRENFLAERSLVKVTPDEYSSPGDPFLVEITDEEHKLVEEKGTIWGHVRQNRSR